MIIGAWAKLKLGIQTAPMITDGQMNPIKDVRLCVLREATYEEYIKECQEQNIPETYYKQPQLKNANYYKVSVD